MASSVNIGADKLEVVDNDVLRFDTDSTYPVVLFRQAYTWSETSQGGYVSLRAPLTAGSARTSPSLTSTVYTLAEYGTEYTQVPSWILGTLDWEDFRGEHRTTIAGSAVLYSPIAAVGGIYTNLVDVVITSAVGGLGPTIVAHLYLSSVNHVVLEFEAAVPTVVAVHRTRTPITSYGIYDDIAIPIRDLNEQEYFSKWEYSSSTDISEFYRYYYKPKRLDVVVGSFIGE